MKAIILILSLLLVSVLSAQADKIGGVSSFNSSTNKLKIPCVKIINSNSTTDDVFFDVEMNKINDSYTFSLSFSEVEDSFLCSSIDSYSKNKDSDYVDDSNSSNLITTNANANIKVKCEIRSDRSRISVDGNNLIMGKYYVTVKSTNNSATTSLKSTIGDEVEFDFDSAPDDIATGDIAISADFLDTEVSAVIFDASGIEVVKGSSTCLIK
jgi:hypothetical protein